MKVIKMTIHNPRQLRALGILSSGIDSIKRKNPNYYYVKSQSKDGYYIVNRRVEGGWGCTCPNFEEYHSDCKHIYAVQFSKQLRLQAEHEVDNDKIQISNVVSCPECHSFNVVKNGQRKCSKGINQRYLCRDCNHRFVMDRTLSRLKATPEVICVAMDLYFKGNSLSKIKHHFKMFYKLNVSRPTIMRWVHKFSKKLNEYSEKHTPKTGELWNCDEMTVNIRKNGVKNNLEWIWNLMDSDTRFLLASTISKDRKMKDARKVLRKGKQQANNKPKALITDGLQVYPDACVKEFYKKSDRTIHFRTPSHRKKFLNQNIERLNGTVRERLKVMRGTHSRNTAQILLDGERFYYNFIKPHMSLNGMTPAQIANLPIPDVDDNPWMSYLKDALNNEN
jgi:transposase-like protein